MFIKEYQEGSKERIKYDGVIIIEDKNELKFRSNIAIENLDKNSKISGKYYLKHRNFGKINPETGLIYKFITNIFFEKPFTFYPKNLTNYKIRMKEEILHVEYYKW